MKDIIIMIGSYCTVRVRNRGYAPGYNFQYCYYQQQTMIDEMRLKEITNHSKINDLEMELSEKLQTIDEIHNSRMCLQCQRRSEPTPIYQS